jgi:hypothetical protein
VNVHAGTAIDGRERKRLQRLCRYIARPAISQERLTLLPDALRDEVDISRRHLRARVRTIGASSVGLSPSSLLHVFIGCATRESWGRAPSCATRWCQPCPRSRRALRCS